MGGSASRRRQEAMAGKPADKKVGTDSLSVRGYGKTAQQAVAPYHKKELPPLAI